MEMIYLQPSSFFFLFPIAHKLQVPTYYSEVALMLYSITYDKKCIGSLLQLCLKMLMHFIVTL